MKNQSVKVWLAGALGPVFVRALGSTLRVHTVNPEVEARARRTSGRVIYSLWHSGLLAPAFTHRGRQIGLLVSQHSDGEIIARIVERLGFRPMRGSASRGGAAGLLGLINHEGGFDLALTPDGPRGPRGTVHPGIVFLSGALGVPVLPAGIAVHPAWHASSWDRFTIPRPFARVAYAFAEPVEVPPGSGDGEIGRFTRLVRERMDEAQARARAALGLPPEPSGG